MNHPPCGYAPGPWRECLDLTCGSQGGRCKYVGPPGKNACRCIAVMPSPMRSGPCGEKVITSALSVYKQQILLQPPLDDSWLAAALARFRAGDETAYWQIAGSCMQPVLELVCRNRTGNEDDFFDLVQEANVAVVEILPQFQGEQTEQLLAHIEHAVLHRLPHLLSGKD